MKKKKRTLLLFFLAVLAFFTEGYFSERREKETLQASLGTTEDPLEFMARMIKPGMTRDEVRKFVRGYRRLVEQPPAYHYPGGADEFEYSFGISLVPSYVCCTISVYYDKQGRVKGEATVEVQ